MNREQTIKLASHHKMYETAEENPLIQVTYNPFKYTAFVDRATEKPITRVQNCLISATDGIQALPWTVEDETACSHTLTYPADEDCPETTDSTVECVWWIGADGKSETGYRCWQCGKDFKERPND